jgi:oligopeptide/dipeptide ABC transporter ATP-binding protein
MYLGRIVEQAPAADVFARPLHPYTRALLAAAPSLEPDVQRKRVAIRGDPPSATRIPPGCAFASRCPHAETACSEAEQTLREAADGHAVACWKWEGLRV